MQKEDVSTCNHTHISSFIPSRCSAPEPQDFYTHTHTRVNDLHALLVFQQAMQYQY